MQYVLFLSVFLMASAVFAQDETVTLYASSNQVNSIIETLELPLIAYDEEPESSAVELLLEDVDDLTASFVPFENVEFYATASNLFDLEMTVDRYDEDQLIDNTPTAIDDTYPVEGSSRFISAGLRFTF